MNLGGVLFFNYLLYFSCNETPLKVHPFLMKLRPCLLFSFIMLALVADAQETDSIPYRRTEYKSIQLVTGVTFGRTRFVEIGVAKNTSGVSGHHPYSSTVFASTEMKFGDKFILGPKIGAWAGGGCGGMAMGLNKIYYTDFDNGTLMFRPEIGFGFSHFKFVYGYNLRLTKNKVPGLDYSVGSLFLGIGVKKLKSKKLT